MDLVIAILPVVTKDLPTSPRFTPSDFLSRCKFSNLCNSDYKILVALQTVETVIRTQRHRLDAGNLPMLSGGWSWEGFCRDLDLCWFA